MIDWGDYKSGAVAVMCSNTDECDTFEALCRAEGVACASTSIGRFECEQISYHMDFGQFARFDSAGCYESCDPDSGFYAVELPLSEFIDRYSYSRYDFDDDLFVSLLGGDTL